MSNIARIGDIAVGTCCCHSDPTCRPWVGVIASGAGTVLAEGSPISRMGDIAVSCHAGIIASGAGTVLTEGSPTARIGDIVVGCPIGVIVTGAATVLAE